MSECGSAQKGIRMGIYIESEKKPKRCCECPCRGGTQTFCRLAPIDSRWLGEAEWLDKAPDWCPIKEYVGGQVMAWTCDRKKECNTSPICGTECTQTFDKEHAVL